MAEPCMKLTCDRRMSQARVGMKVSTVVFRLIFQTKHFWGRLVEKMALQKKLSSQLLSARRTEEGRSKGYSSFSSLIRFWLEPGLSQWPQVILKKVPVSLPVSFKLNRFPSLKQVA